jgi:hypothetical protein
MIVRMLLAALLSVLGASCTQYYSAHPAYASAIGKSQPTLTGSYDNVELEYHHARVYTDGVMMWAKTPGIYPQKANVYDIDRDGAYESVYVCPDMPNRWKVYHNLKPVPGVTVVPNSMTADDAQSYIWMAIGAKNKVRAERKVSRPAHPKVPEVETQTGTWYRVYPKEDKDTQG